MVEQRDMTPQDWVRLSKEEKAAYREFKEDADREAAQAEGRPMAANGRADGFLAKESLSEVQMPDGGDCAFEAVCAMLPKNSNCLSCCLCYIYCCPCYIYCYHGCLLLHLLLPFVTSTAAYSPPTA